MPPIKLLPRLDVDEEGKPLIPSSVPVLEPDRYNPQPQTTASLDQAVLAAVLASKGQPPPEAPKPQVIPGQYPTTDYDLPSEDIRPRLDEAREYKAKVGLASNLGKALATSGAAITGGKPDTAFYDSLAQQGAQPEQDALKDDALNRLYAQAAKAKEVTDPASKVNRRVQDAFIQNFPDLVQKMGGEGAVRALTKAQLDDMFGMSDKAGLRSEQNRAHTADEAFKEKKQAQDYELGKERNRIAEISADKKGDPSPIGELNLELKKQAMVNDLGKRTAMYSEVPRVMQQLEDISPGITKGNVPANWPLTRTQRGLLALPGGIGTVAADSKAIEAQNAIRNLQDLIKRVRSGAATTGAEDKLYKQLLGDQLFTDPRATALAINQFRQLMGQRLKNIQQPYVNGPVPLFQYFDGTKYTDPIFQDGPTAATASAPAKTPRRLMMNGKLFEEGPDGHMLPVVTK